MTRQEYEALRAEGVKRGIRIGGNPKVSMGSKELDPQERAFWQRQPSGYTRVSPREPAQVATAQRVSVPAKKRHRIGGLQYAAMMGVAMFFDLIQLVLTFLIIGLIINTVLSIVIFFIFIGWFATSGHNFLTLKRPIRDLILIAVKLAPGLNAIPIWTMCVWSEIRLVHQEDREYNKSQAKVKAA